MQKKGVLLINLGTPDGSDRASVRRYLTEFLNDPRVIDINPVLRFALVNLLIVPTRAGKSAALYQKVWMKEGSPLLVYGKQLAQSLRDTLGEHYQVELGMRYGNPSIASALKKLAACDQLIVIPLFPQYSSAATGSAIEKTLMVLSKQWNLAELVITSDFYDHPDFIAAYAGLIKQHIAEKQVDVLVFSYHGLPERHVNKSGCATSCDHVHACPAIAQQNRFCYRAQCYATTAAIATLLGLQPHQYRVAFQSRLGRTPWIKPYTDLLLPELIQQGTKNIAVVSPSFVADCLETLEEINMRAREQWQSLGGGEFTFIPCLNADPRWVAMLANHIRTKT